MLFRDRICAVVAAPTAREMARQLRQALKLTRTVELRLDWLRSVNQDIDFLGGLPMRSNAARIATCRRKANGGRYRKSVQEQSATLLSYVLGGCSWCDIEIETLQSYESLGLQFRKDLMERLRKHAKVIVSFHDFRRSPRGLSSIVRRLERCGGDAVKIATQCNSIADSLRVLALAKGRRNVVAVPMGDAGLPARVLALRYGSALAYAAVGEKTAPGQLTLDEMKNLYRAHKLDRRTHVYGVIGNPVGHSLSPLMQNVGFQARKMNAVYLPFLVKDLPDFLKGVAPLGIAGFSVTLPHKERILRHLDDCDPLARVIGAVNTVVVRGGGKLYGYNTDYVGVLRALERRVQLRGSRVLLYGAGGAARAAAFALAQGGAVVSICARRRESARALARAVGGEVVERRRLRREFFDAIVNCTPVGMHPHANASPLRAEELNCRVVMDLIYRPRRTRLLQLAKRRGIQTVSGVEMFLAQGSAQWEIWTGLRAPVAAMRRAVLQALRREEKKSGE